MITREEIVGKKELSAISENNLQRLLAALNKFRLAYGKPMAVTSGYRTMEEHINIYKGNAKKAGVPFDEAKVPKHSAHLSAEACDFSDKDRKLAQFCVANQPLLAECGLYMESPVVTTSWVHLQVRMPPSGKRIFNP